MRYRAAVEAWAKSWHVGIYSLTSGLGSGLLGPMVKVFATATAESPLTLLHLATLDIQPRGVLCIKKLSIVLVYVLTLIGDSVQWNFLSRSEVHGLVRCMKLLMSLLLAPGSRPLKCNLSNREAKLMTNMAFLVNCRMAVMEQAGIVQDGMYEHGGCLRFLVSPACPLARGDS
jgi:hypothetical protein